MRLPGQTYAQSLALGGVDVNKYISTGNNRDAYDGAIQPRVGFSYDFSEDESFVLFGGAGRAYDRNVFDYLALERSKGTFPTYECRLQRPGHIRARRRRDANAWSGIRRSSTARTSRRWSQRIRTSAARST